MVFAVGVWFVWRVALPRLGHYELVPVREKVWDGTVITVVSGTLVI